VRPYLAHALPAYPLFLAIAIGGAALVATLSLQRCGIALAECLWMLLMLAAAGLLGAKLYSLLEDGSATWPRLGGLTQGYRYPGALIGLAAAAMLFRPLLCRGVSLATLGDALMPAVGVGAALLRLGCFAYGCCFGAPSQMPWAVRFPAHSPAWFAQLNAGWIAPNAPASLPVHPLQLYFMLLSLTGVACALWLGPRKAYAGQVILAFLSVDQFGKFGLEYLRHDPLPGVQLASLLIGLAAAATLGVAAVPRGHRARGPYGPRLSGSSDSLRAATDDAAPDGHRRSGGPQRRGCTSPRR
jgi:phosphatidylglycerol:prolipoprotein diacylglycerol transferase